MSIFKAKTVDAAIANGLKELNLTAEQADIVIINKAGFLKKAEVNITPKNSDLPIKTESKNCKAKDAPKPCCTANDKNKNSRTPESDVNKDALCTFEKVHTRTDGKSLFALHENDMPVINFLTKLFEEMEFDCTLETKSTKDFLNVTILGEDARFIVGTHGEALDNLQYLCLLVANKQTRFKKKLVLDAEGYRDLRTAALTSLALKLAMNVVNNNRSVQMEPMNPFERRVIHTALQENNDVTTTSDGSDPNRYVVIHPVKTTGDSNIHSSYTKDAAITCKPAAKAAKNDDLTATNPEIHSLDKETNKTDEGNDSLCEKNDSTSTKQSDPKVSPEVDIYDNSVSRLFKTGGLNTRSLGNKKRF